MRDSTRVAQAILKRLTYNTLLVDCQSRPTSGIRTVVVSLNSMLREDKKMGVEDGVALLIDVIVVLTMTPVSYTHQTLPTISSLSVS